jgi:hypothetical protein
MLPIVRDATNRHTDSRYARLETIDRGMRPIYTRHGFAVRFGSEPSPQPGWLRITATVSHADGYSETCYLDAPPDMAGSRGTANKTPVQAIGSVVTYLRRYLLTMVFNIVLTDEDGDGATGQPAESARDRQAARYAAPAAPAEATHPLDEPNGTAWLRNLRALLVAARSRGEVAELGGDARVGRVLNGPTTPSLIREGISDMLREAYARFPDEGPQQEPESHEPESTLTAMLHEIGGMDRIALDGLGGNAVWRSRVRDVVAGWAPDEDRINAAIVARRAALDAQPRQQVA